MDASIPCISAPDRKHSLTAAAETRQTNKYFALSNLCCVLDASDSSCVQKSAAAGRP